MLIKGIVLGHSGDGRRGCHWHCKTVGSVVSCVLSPEEVRAGENDCKATDAQLRLRFVSFVVTALEYDVAHNEC